ncbi:hypothetical protein, partial [uncultured Thiodictyon sp.]|uniref:hypothetical protein n=1 Tax=uncultured Thiodictyon sp. TaxID=1846217 RepID=UPI0025CE53A1
MNTIRSLLSRCSSLRGLPVALWAVALVYGSAFAGDNISTGSLTPGHTVRIPNDGAEPIDALRRYYATSDSRDRPIVLDAIQEVMRNDAVGIAVIAYRISNERDAEGQAQGEPFEGLAWIEKQHGKWKTLQLYDQVQAAEVNARYAQALAAG